jgi:ubiquinone/menaquinone biosynthesis C-methylase UbiE
MLERLFDRILGTIKSVKYLYLRFRIRAQIRRNAIRGEPRQGLAIYSSPEFAAAVGVWGVETAWNEVQYFLVNCRGRVLDIACGPCRSLITARSLFQRDIYGCDISAYLLLAAVKSGVPPSKLTVCDATLSPYRDDAFDYSYSIGSLEHFSEAGIAAVVRETQRITRYASFHQIPTSRSGKDEGWIVLQQSYFNNSTEWWRRKFKEAYQTVHVLDSSWEDPISVGKWFVLIKERE